jgi:hypothetical protein
VGEEPAARLSGEVIGSRLIWGNGELHQPAGVQGMAKKPKHLTQDEIFAAAVAEIGIAMARAAGVECGSPTNIRIMTPKPVENNQA